MADERVQGWDDDGEYEEAVGRSWLTVVVAVGCFVVVIGVVVLGVLGVFGALGVLSVVSD
ncbi:hypothetical protein [Streptomyces sp. NPDC048611]|uniref:hypothetical protein n=1 Tax=Streptomyces sp. NPDC048611 TaxID=3155635 RepID=UPI0034368522